MGCDHRSSTTAGTMSGSSHWVDRTLLSSCSANAKTSGLGCTVSHCTKMFGSFACGKTRADCGQTVEVCGRPYHCDCEACSDVPDYPSRMTRDRYAVIQAPTASGNVMFTVSYEGGKCEGIASSHYGSSNLCMVSAWDDSHVGGCDRHVNDPGTGTFACSSSASVCGGVRAYCDCSNGGQVVRISDAFVAASAPPVK